MAIEPTFFNASESDVTRAVPRCCDVAKMSVNSAALSAPTPYWFMDLVRASIACSRVIPAAFESMSACDVTSAKASPDSSSSGIFDPTNANPFTMSVALVPKFAESSMAFLESLSSATPCNPVIEESSFLADSNSFIV